MQKMIWFLIACLATAASAGAKTTLTWIDYHRGQDAYDRVLANYFKQYSLKHPEIEIKRRTVVFADFRSEIINAAALNTVPDIVLIDNPDHQAMADIGAFADITDKIQNWAYKDLYFKGPWMTTIFKGRNYGIPLFSSATVLWYNEELLKKAGITQPPRTWNELRAAAAKLTTNNQYGLAFSAIQSEEGTFTFLPFLWSAGSDVDRIGNQASVKALTFFRDLVVKDGSVSIGVAGWGQTEVKDIWLQGQAAMMINGPWQLRNIEAAHPEWTWDIVPIPKDKESVSILGGENFAFGKDGNVAEAWKLVQWLTEPERLKELIRSTGNIPNREDLADDPEWTEDHIARTFLEAVRTARSRAYGPNYLGISGIISKMLRDVLTNFETPEEAANQARANLRPLLENNGS
jgi:multiple sugar transport system substrate-binding protein